MRPHRLTTPAVRRFCVLAAALCLALAAPPAGAMPYDNDRPSPPPARHVVTPTVVKETIVRPTADVPLIVLVLAGGGVIVAMFGAGYLGARMTRRAGR